MNKTPQYYTLYMYNPHFPEHSQKRCFMICSAESLERNKRFIQGRIAIENRGYAERPWELHVEPRE